MTIPKLREAMLDMNEAIITPDLVSIILCVAREDSARASKDEERPAFSAICLHVAFSYSLGCVPIAFRTLPVVHSNGDCLATREEAQVRE